jgi:hypothetical protein
MFNAHLSSGRAARWFVTAAFGVVGLLSAGLSAKEDSKSAVAAKELGEALDRAKLDAIAAPDPSDPTQFVAALYFPGAQLLVVSAKYSAPVLLTAKLGKKEYRDIYIDLSSASIPASKVFIMDQGANGLVKDPGGDQPADSWEQATKSTLFEGDWKKAKMASEAEYDKAFADADARYAQMLTLLAAEAKKTGAGS